MIEDEAPEANEPLLVRLLRRQLAAERAVVDRLQQESVWLREQLQRLSTEARIQEARVTLFQRYLGATREREKALFEQVAEHRRTGRIGPARDGGRLQSQAVSILRAAGRHEKQAWGVWEQSRIEVTLEEIRQAEGADTVVLSDTFGLPVAAVGDAAFTDAVAALAGVAQALATHATNLLPFQDVRSLVVEDDREGLVASYTFFEQDGERFLLAILSHQGDSVRAPESPPYHSDTFAVRRPRSEAEEVAVQPLRRGA